MDGNIILTKNLSKKYKRNMSVDGVNLKINKGEIFGFLGPNGAGKTTTIRMLLGLIKPTKGEIELFGQDFTKNRTKILQRIGSLVESPSYYGNLTGFENLEAVRRLRGLSEKRVTEVLEVVRLNKVANRLVKEYSLGMKQRLGIAAALLSEPELLILDEPTNGLDPAGIQEIRELIKELPHQNGMTVLVSSHLLSEIDQMATQVGIITEGKMIFQDSIEVLRKKRQPLLKIAVNNTLEASNILKDKGIIPTIHKESLWVSQTDPEFVSEINSTLVHSGLSVYRLEEVKRTLEDIFLDLTGKGASL
ncbi:ABC transporter ATP-binding protein (plasmid) [Priestia aryabhattai]|nr:ABC transporter ATP-binding protein [Priestia aryabhattai]MCG0050787.1 ABC transporter ATP-binding protein [Priestia aryabhattai]